MPRPRATLRDWLFGASGKRRLIAALLAQDDEPIRQADLAREAGLTVKGTVDEHLAALVQAGLARRHPDGRFSANVASPLHRPLVALLQALDGVPEVPVERP